MRILEAGDREMLKGRCYNYNYNVSERDCYFIKDGE